MICSFLDTQGAGKNFVILQEAPQIAFIMFRKSFYQGDFSGLDSASL